MELATQHVLRPGYDDEFDFGLDLILGALGQSLAREAG